MYVIFFLTEYIFYVFLLLQNLNSIDQDIFEFLLYFQPSFIRLNPFVLRNPVFCIKHS